MKAKGLHLFLLLVLFLFSGSPEVYAQQTGGGTAGYATSKSSITGFVFDAEGEPLPGVTVKVPKRTLRQSPTSMELFLSMAIQVTSFHSAT